MVVLRNVATLLVALTAAAATGRCALLPRDADNHRPPPSRNCYPSLDFHKPLFMPRDNSEWWCDPSTEYAFVGFSYEITACQNLATLTADFLNARYRFNSRYIRLYGFCDNEGYYNDVITAAWIANLGVHALIWFGFDGGDEWIGRRDALFKTLHSNPLAPFVTRVVQFGSEPLYDQVLPVANLTEQVVEAKKNLSSLGIPVTVSELAYGYQSTPGSQALLDVLDSINIHQLPFFAQDTSTANNSWHDVVNDLDYFIDNGKGKKMYFDENGWPSVTSPGVQNNSIYAVANVENEMDYYLLLDSKCEFLKRVTGGGVGWFWHIYSDNMEPGYGLYNETGRQKFPFTPKTHC